MYYVYESVTHTMILNVVGFGLSEEDGCDCDGTLN